MLSSQLRNVVTSAPKYNSVKTFVGVRLYHCYYAILSYRSNELSNLNVFHESKLCSTSRTIGEYLSQCIVPIVRVFIILYRVGGTC
jgi:hypothetical protein